MNQNTVIGIDYSLSCPSITVLSPDGNFANSKHYFLTGTKKYNGIFNKHITGDLHRPYINSMERYHNIATWSLNIIGASSNPRVFIEDYSLNSKGKVFNIAENCGILKYQLYMADILCYLVSPKSIKKFAGNGNSSKDMMYEFFQKKTGYDLMTVIGYSATSVGSPLGDVVDSYFLALYGKDMLDNDPIRKKPQTL